jgi:hypothetical protein
LVTTATPAKLALSALAAFQAQQVLGAQLVLLAWLVTGAPSELEASEASLDHSDPSVLREPLVLTALQVPWAPLAALAPSALLAAPVLVAQLVPVVSTALLVNPALQALLASEAFPAKQDPRVQLAHMALPASMASAAKKDLPVLLAFPAAGVLSALEASPAPKAASVFRANQVKIWRAVAPWPYVAR